MENEVRFYYETGYLINILDNLKKRYVWSNNLELMKKTIQYNHCDDRYDFYSQEIDGRFREEYH